MKNSTIQLILIALLVMISGAKNADASHLQLTHDPLFLNQSVPPAMAVTFDDSGSMAWGYMGTFYGYNTRQFADPSLNKVYYNPNIEYRPPIGADGVEFANSSFTNAKIDGFDDRTNAPRVDLSQNFIPIGEYYYYWDGNYSVRFARIPNTPGVDTVNTGTYNDYYPNQTTRNASGRAAFYYNGNTLVTVPASQQTNFANWYTFYSNRLKMGKTAVSRAFATFGPNFKIAWQQLNNNTTFPALDKFELDHRDDFFDWLFAVPSNGGTPLRNAFYRAGSLFQKESSYSSVDFNANITCQQNFHIALSDGEWNGSFSPSVYQDETSVASGLRGDSDKLYGAYTGNDDQQIYPKSESGTTLSDIAYHFWSTDLMTGTYYKNNVKRFKGDYTNMDGTTIEFTDVDEWKNPAFVWNPKNDPAYWQHLVTYNVGMGLEASRTVDYINDVAAGNAPDCPLDVNLTAREAVYRGLRTGSCAWPNATNGANKIDDVWHASINSRGDFFSANDPQELTDALNAVVNSILERLSRGSTSSVSSGVVTSSTKAYTPGFDSSNWTGNLFSRSVNSDGTFGDIEWDLSCHLTGGNCEATGESVTKQTTRRVYTRNTNNGNRVRFKSDMTNNNVLSRFNESSEELRTRLNISTPDLISYLLGNQDLEIKNNGALRNRASVLSDIVHSSPLVQVGPTATYNDLFWTENSAEEAAYVLGKSYEKYKIDNQDRLNLTYIGSNSGMLHAVNIEDGNKQGQERWAYIPTKALENIHKLADPLYQHWSYVDNTPVIGDAFINSNWNTVLVSGMRYGGQAYFALNVTDTTSNKPELMWEFSDEDDADMGYSYGKVSIARIASTGDWVAFIPNGYNNSQKDYPSLPDDDPKNIIGDGSAVLYVVRLSDGHLLAKLDTNVGTKDTPNGMAPAMPVVSKFYGGPGGTTPSTHNEDGANIAYAGDLYGNLWRFNLNSADPSDWEKSTNIKMVVEARGIKEQPITTQPRVLNFPGPNKSKERDNIVMFATGKYIEIPDRSINLVADQYVVGILDGPDATSTSQINSTQLKEQTMIVDDNIRQFSTYNNVDYTNSNVKGWKFKLSQKGERVANPMALFGSEFLLVTSTVTAGEDPCEAGGVSWLLAFDPMTGYKPNFGDLFKTYELDVDGNPTSTITLGSGIKIADLIIGSPPIVENQGGGNSSIIIEGAETTTVIGLSKFTWRRRGWKNILTE